MGFLTDCKIYIPQGCLPLVLMFDIKEDVEVEPQCITALMEQLDVFISIKPKPKQPSKVRHTHTHTHAAECTFDLLSLSKATNRRHPLVTLHFAS